MLGRLAFSQSITQLQKKANDLFDKQDYSSALVDFRQLLAQNPISMEFNYKYGICLFYSDNRKNAKRYFDFVMRQNTCPSETYYYVAKLYHYDYKFATAIDYYQKYLDNTPEKIRSKNVVNDIQQCKNGKLLLQNPTALRIINANRFSISKFYLNYDLQSRTGGFFTNEELQSKIDKKNNFLPMYYFSRGDSLKFFASYGTNNNKDIYFSVKNGVDLWSTATKISGDVNTSFDEDYPFFDAQKGLLYFSSKGHNSIGGYDLFQVAFNPLENVAQEISNLDFPYSSADDDFLFVPEENQKTAYFSSNRNCEKNKIDVYLVENGKKKSTIQLIKGDFHDLVDEKNKLAQIKVVDVNSGEEFGPFTTDDNGNYSIILPGGGKYKFMVTVEGSRKLFENIMLVPQINNTRKLAQTLRYSVQDSDEFLEFINNFNDDQLASDEDKMLVLSAIASLKMNPSLIQDDPKSKDDLENTSSVLKDLGFINPDEKEALSMLNDELLSIELIEEELSNTLTNAISIQNENNKALKIINNTIQEIKVELSDASLTFDKKIELLDLLLNQQKDKIVLQEQLVAMNNVITENEKALNLNIKSGITKNAAEINEKVLALSMLNNKDSIDVFLFQNKDKIKSLLLNKTVIENTNDDAIDSLENELLAITKGLLFERKDLKTKKDSINVIIQELTERKELANKKDQLVISDQIIREQKKAEILENDKFTSITSLVNNEKKIIREIANVQVKIDLSQSNYKAGEEQIDLSKVKALTISEDDISALYQEKYEVENSISIIESNNKERIALNKKIDEAILLKDDTIKYKSLLVLLSNKEKVLKSEIEDAQKSNNFLLLNNYSEELQVLQSLQNKYTEELALNEIESKTLQSTKEDPVIVSEETVETELALEEAKTKTPDPVIVSEETVEAELALEAAKTKTPDPVIVSKETVETELALEAAKTKTPDPVIVSKETVETELALEAAKTKTPDPVIVSKETVEAELALESAKTKETDPVIVSKETVEAELALEAAKTKTPDPVIVSKETVESELALESAKTKTPDRVIVSKETVEAELALEEAKTKTPDPVIVSNETVEAELALEAAKTKTTDPVIVSNETVETELALEEAKTKTPDPVIVSKETEEAELALEAAKTKTTDPVIVSKETVEAELALESAKTKTTDPVIVSKETVEAELALESAKTKTTDPVIVSKETVEAELALESAKTKTTDPVIVSKETVETELALGEAKTKTTDPVIVSKETVEAELALEAAKTKTTDPVIVSEETVDAGQKENPALIIDNNSSYSSAIEKQIQQFNSEIPNDLILSFNETRKLEQQILTEKDPNDKESGIQVVKVLDATNNLIASQLILSSKINALEDEFPILKESYDKNDIINALVLQKEVLETAKINEPSIGTELINKAIAIINNEIIQRTSESQELSKQVPFKFMNTQQLSEDEKVALIKDPSYYEYLKLRTAYNQMAHTRDSLQYEIALNKQKLDAMMNENNRVASVSESEHELAKLLNEQLRSLNDYSEKLENQGKIITNLANQPKMEVMLLDKIQPLQLTKSQTNYDFKIDAKQTNTSLVYLPILSESPSGLIYRVQLGAFRKPVSIDKFREFSPVSGEVLANGLTCYLAGFFNNATLAINARKEIRNFGYADAFIVAYCDGKRISLAEAKELERLGRCVPKSQNELSIDVARLFETAEKNANENLSIENQDVFYTVQVGVYNKKINNNQLLGIEELDAYQAPNGQYRYSSGKFSSLEDAKNRKVSVISKGITDAYIVAYSNGKRIDINTATALLQQNNRTPEINNKRNVTTTTAIDFSKLEAPLEPTINYIQFIKNVDAGITNDLLGISNKGGTFIFNPTQKHVISGYIDVNTITAFERIFYADMSMESKIKTSKVCSVYSTNSTIKSAVHDWLLHCNIPYTIITKSNAIEIQFVILQNSSIEEIELMANKYDYVIKINEL